MAQQQIGKQLVPQTISYFLGNLASSPGGGYLAYLNNKFQQVVQVLQRSRYHITGFVTFSGHYKLSKELQDLPDPVLGFQFVAFDGGCRFVLAAVGFVRVYSENCQNLLYTYKNPTTSPTLGSRYFRCISAVTLAGQVGSVLLVSQEKGRVLVMDGSKLKFTSISKEILSVPGQEIVAMANFHSCLLVSDEKGRLFSFALDAQKKFRLIQEAQNQQQETPNVCLSVHESQAKVLSLACGNYLGYVQVYSLADEGGFTLRWQISSHVRLLTCVQWLEDGRVLATAGEDSFVNFWRFEEGKEVQIQKS